MLRMKSKPITFSFDLEDHRPADDAWPPRYPELTHKVLDWMDERGIVGTVFIVGILADRHPDLVREVASRGHEVGLHNWQHIQLQEQQPEEFREGIRRGKATIEDLTGEPMIGFRAPTGSVTPKSAWAVDILKEEGYEYSSSVMPGYNPLNCFPGAPEQPFLYANGLAEFPAVVTGSRFFGFPYLGGTYVRVLPAPVLKGIHRLAPRDEGAVLYCHPYDFDTDEPFWWVPDVGRLSPLLWMGRKSMFRKLEYLTSDGTSQPFRDQMDIPRRGPVFDHHAPPPSIHKKVKAPAPTAA